MRIKTAIKYIALFFFAFFSLRNLCKSDTKTSAMNKPDFYYKELLEKNKLEREVTELDRAWWKKPAWLAFLTTAFVSGFSFFYFLSSGTFSARRELLQLEIAQFDTIKSRLLDSIKNYRDTVFILKTYGDSLSKQYTDLEATVMQLRYSSFKLTSENDILRTMISTLNSDISKTSPLLGKANREIGKLKDSIDRFNIRSAFTQNNIFRLQNSIAMQQHSYEMQINMIRDSCARSR